MYFRFRYEIVGYNISFKEGPIILNLNGPRILSATIMRLAAGSARPEAEMDMIQVVAEIDPPRKAVAAIREMVQQSAGSQQKFIAAPPVPYDALPGAYRDFAEKLYDELADAAIDIFTLARWRFAMPGPVKPFKARGLEWSEDKESWRSLPYRITLQLTPTVSKKLRSEDIPELESMIGSNAREPLAHTMLREAKASAAATGSYSSALVMGIAALEVGAKHLIAELVPNAEWLALHAPSPPVIRVISEYLPNLPARLHVNGKPLVAPGALVETLRKGVTARNAAAHAGLSLPSKEFVERVLDAVSDMLWIFDVYAGCGWAIDFLSADTRAALVPPVEKSD